MSLKSKILIIDDDLSICQILRKILIGEGYLVMEAHSGKEGQLVLTDNNINLLLLDLQLPDIDGLEIAKQMSVKHSSIPIVILSAHGSVSKAVAATKIGVYDFLEKPLDRERILLTVRNALTNSELKKELEYYRKDSLARYKMVGQSPAIKQVFSLIEKVAATKSPVLILGENGVGKELVALAIHNGSPRAKRPMVKINCAAIPDNLIESELFGHTKGAFTGAHIAKKGRFQVADGGILFLDEIGDLSPSAQAKLLRFLESGEIQRVGATEPELVDVRVIAATNKELRQMVSEEKFREDLYYRLNYFPIFVPPLRQRKADIQLLLDFFIDEYVKNNGVLKPQITQAAINYISDYDWPGNVRQLRSFISQLMLLLDKNLIDLEVVKPILSRDNIYTTPQESPTKPLAEARKQFEKEYITNVLEGNEMQVTKAAEILGMDRANLYRKMRQLGISVEK